MGACTVASVVAVPAFAPASWPRSDATSRVSVSTVASRRATRSASGTGGWAGGACIATVSGVAPLALRLRCCSVLSRQNPIAAPSTAPVMAEKSPINAAIPPTMKPIAVKAQFISPCSLSRIVIGLRSDVCRSRRYRHGRQANRHALLTTVAAMAACVAISLLAGNVSQRLLRIFRVGAVSRRAPSGVAARLFARSCFLLVDALRFRLSRATRDRT
ncbi:hypothetical protein BLA6863_01566 [Burkholderia lata]|uniref:Uncharacterized protein n=1 Tax=Burkholderia lata (strain ATCC 17760 / DSM 23089 / LMG 22485 / NCIMB 9086 / R18194 / 383) TaxID=482957 RepID=A0A6P2J2D6_BURL3|nr:hypothetical protein BLA6863_01566 [Burkholderia lata]